MVAPFCPATHFRLVLANEFFTPARLKEMRDEIHRDGFVADTYVSSKPDCPVFGFNLACLYPFPTEVRDAYETLSTQLAALDPGVYVYPHWETHVTIATFVNFTKQPAPDCMEEPHQLMELIADQLKGRFGGIAPFDLWIEAPVLSRNAAFLPLSDPGDSIGRIRSVVRESLASHRASLSLQLRLERLGLTIPSIVHSTIMRFKKVPADTQAFLSAFDKIAQAVPRVAMRVNEIYITTETKPYMRAGEIVRRFRL